MWERSKNLDSPAPPPTPSIPPPIQRAVEPQRKRTEIGTSISIIGEIYSEEDLFIDGQVEGELSAIGSKLTVGPNGKAKSNVTAREVEILGEIRGNINAEQKIAIRNKGSVIGNIKTMGIVIDDDAYFKGSIDIIRRNGDS